jgi:hypothetical protein
MMLKSVGFGTKKNISMNYWLIFSLICIVAPLLIILYIEIQTLEIFRFVIISSYVILIFFAFNLISQKVISFEAILGEISKISSKSRRLTFTPKKIEEISHDILQTCKILIGIGLICLLWGPLRYIFTFIHEMSHAIVGIIYNFEIVDFIIDIDGTSYVRFAHIPYGPILSIISIWGSLGAIISGIIIIGILLLKKGIKLEVLLSIFGMILLILIWQIDYWIGGAINVTGDAQNFLLSNPYISSYQLAQICFTIKFWMLYFIMVFFFIKIGLMSRISLLKLLPDIQSYINYD